ncbi:pyridoxal phosphate-dependent aminotransferase [Desulfothermus okinawensis JCM 13304]
MAEFSRRISMVKPSATLAMNAKAAELKSQGVEVISLAVGQPDLAPPESVLKGAREAIDKLMTKYTPAAGLPEVLDAVCEYYNRFYNAGAKRENVIITNGGKQGLYNLMQILVDPGDEVLIPAPYWLSYPDMVILAGGTPKIVPTEAENNFMTSPSELEKYVTEKTKILVLNTPSNPTGCHYSQDKFDEICEFAISKGIFIISDEIYDQLIYPPAHPTSASKWFKKYPDKVAIVNGLAKSFAVPGWRIGYVISDSLVIKNLSKLQGQSTSNVCSISQMAALRGLLGDLSFLEENRKKFFERRNYILGRINSIEGIICPEPMGAFYVFPRVDNLYTDKINSSQRLCEYLLEKANVALVPGIAFGDDRCIRFSYAVDISVLEKAMDQVEKALKAL